MQNVPVFQGNFSWDAIVDIDIWLLVEVNWAGEGGAGYASGGYTAEDVHAGVPLTRLELARPIPVC